MTSYLEALMGGYGSEQDYLQQDPFFGAGRSVAQWQMPQATNDWEAILGPALQGALAGTLTGYGRSNARETAWDAYRANPLLKASTPAFGPVSDGAVYADALMRDYSKEVAPEGWSANLAQKDLLLNALQRQANMEAEAKKKELLAKILLEGSPEAVATQEKLAAAKKKGEVLAEIEAYGGDVTKNPNSPQYKASKDALDYGTTLRKEFQGSSAFQEYQTADKGYRTLVKAMKDPSATADLDFVYGAIQMIEPGMAVREGEQSAVRNSSSIPSSWKGYINKALLGESALPPEVREGIMDLATRRYEEHSRVFNEGRQKYRGLAELGGANPEAISFLPEAPTPEALGATKPTKLTGDVAGAASARPSGQPFTGKDGRTYVFTD